MHKIDITDMRSFVYHYPCGCLDRYEKGKHKAE